MKKCLILGVTGQDGSYMAELLLSKKYKVFGLIRKSATGNTKNIDHLINNPKIFNKIFFLERGDLLDTVSINNVIAKIKPHEIYNFADQDHVGWSYNIPSYSFKATTLSVIEILEIIKRENKKIKYFQPISSNIYSGNKQKKISENNVLYPTSLYGLAKSSTYLACKMYKELFNLHICGAIFFNHESPRRSDEYVTKKIVKQTCEIFNGKRKYIYLGDINAKIDWGYAKDYVYYSWKIMNLKKPDFFIIGTGSLFSVRDFLNKCFNYVGLNYKKYLKINKKLLRPSKTIPLKADISKAKKIINYKVDTNIDSLVKIMMENELKNIN